MQLCRFRLVWKNWNALGEREGWRVFPASRDGLFEVVEFWIENRLMLELLTPTMAPQYLKLFSPESLSTLIAQFEPVAARR